MPRGTCVAVLLVGLVGNVAVARGAVAPSPADTCVAGQATPAPAAANPAKTFSRITYSDTGGITGKGTGKWIEIQPDGSFQAKRRGASDVTGKLTPAERTELAKRVSAVDWAAVRDFYQGGADTYYDVLVITIGGKEFKTSADEHATPPAALRSLLTYLNTLYTAHAGAGK